MKKTVRTQRTDGGVTHSRILDMAGELFASTGFAETTNKMIAAKAGVDLASINYHFGSRNGLYQAVLVEAHRRLVSVESLQQLASTDLSARERLKALIQMLVENATSEHSWHARVLSREFLSPTSNLRALIESEVPPKLASILNIIEDITAIPSGDPALLRCLASVIAPCAMLLVVGRNVSPVADEIRGMPTEDLVEHLYGFALGGLEAVGHHRSRPEIEK
ncbi:MULTISPECIES: TetR/AcrR family transcriptional regulator [Hyphomicrobiales]|uniref:TetR/AcrR family transcriptional regulator n=1 Tax=Hyphomicrobiales TaxID=356 RepID=UPI000C50D74D|nr:MULTISPECIES: TetR/AcrR family transcriptional regulator [Hyphomicrobiales]MAA99225.1 transcriptional regulator [Stappia sp.]MAM93391.1 transcriptional regulator [Parvibaculum sp.]MBM19472.1 transcriptional regulator [Stappia sp.]NIJ42837.1 AcrR family transcriptional regulator [Parvibaculum indicum]|tara:strand:- start:7762 stop:8424 length:663 start_codon:yes stop_codon:yes gene_type:complete